MRRSRAEKMCILLLKYIPVICAFLMFLHVVFLECGFHYCFAELAVLTMVSIMILVWSKVFKFCLIHIISSLYTVDILWCSYIQRYVGFGNHLEQIRVSALYFGFIILLILVNKHAEDYKRLIEENH